MGKCLGDRRLAATERIKKKKVGYCDVGGVALLFLLIMHDRAIKTACYLSLVEDLVGSFLFLLLSKGRQSRDQTLSATNQSTTFKPELISSYGKRE